MSAIEFYLIEAKKTRGTWHKLVINNLRRYMSALKEEEIISAINKIQDATLLPILWEVGLSSTLQDVANRRSMKLAASAEKEGEK